MRLARLDGSLEEAETAPRLVPAHHWRNSRAHNRSRSPYLPDAGRLRPATILLRNRATSPACSLRGAMDSIPRDGPLVIQFNLMIR